MQMKRIAHRSGGENWLEVWIVDGKSLADSRKWPVMQTAALFWIDLATELFEVDTWELLQENAPAGVGCSSAKPAPCDPVTGDPRAPQRKVSEAFQHQRGAEHCDAVIRSRICRQHRSIGIRGPCDHHHAAC